ncbi:MAG: DPP IV N-terminal domain-containing protein [Bacteroidales bacterium]|nr:DPP IV N-terminal domain-containing protein [Bacteroidales bacterium]
MKKSFFLAIALTLAVSVFAQNKLLSSKQLMSGNLYPHAPMRGIQFVGSTNQIAYIQDTALYMGQPGKTKVCLTLSQLNMAVVAAGYESMRYMPNIEMLNAKELCFTYAGKLLQYNLSKRVLTTIAKHPSDNAAHQDMEENGHKTAYTVNNNLYVYNDGNVFSIESPDQDIIYGQSVHRNEFGIEKGTFWSPKGNYLAFYRMDQSMVTDYPLVNTTARIAREQPFKYPMAGMKSHEVTVGIYNASVDSLVYLDTRRDESVAERENYLTNISWDPNEEYLYIAKINREQNHMWLERYYVSDGEFDTVLFEEQNSRYVEPCDPMFFRPGHPDQFFWFSLRDGYKHLYLYNTDGQMLKQVTTGKYEVEGIIGFDAKGENLFIYANKDNPIGRAAYKVNLTTLEMTPITPTEGTHRVTVSADGTTVIDIYSGVSTPGRCNICRFKGNKLVSEKNLYDLSNPLEEYAMPKIEMGSLKAADGVTDLYYRLITPPNMEAGKKYPTLVYVYGGPHSQLVTDSWLGGGNLYFLFLAQQGYVVFTLDNRGTDNRGFEFESCTHRHLGQIEMADQLEGVKFLQSLPYVDKDRMGVEGWSFGGFMTITMKLAHPEIFKVGCAGGPVIDWKWYEVMYGERYMDTPQENPEGYDNNSLLNKAKDLDGRLLVIHGAEDNTVVWQNSIEFIDACIKAGKQVDYFIYPHHEHNVRGYDRIHLYEKMFDYYETFLK